MEIEIKLAPALPHQAAAVFADPEIAPWLGPEHKYRMASRYFDTAEGGLRACRYTLRLRREDDTGVCTLKSSEDGHGARLELEAPADTLEQGVKALLALDTLPADARAALEAGGFVQVAGATFVRTAALWQRGELSFELCHDQGQLERAVTSDMATGVRTGALGELELELKSGNRADMAAIADGLCARHNLQIGTVSKLGQALTLGDRDAGRAVSPFFVSNELLNYSVRMGWLDIEMDENKMLHYRLTDAGARELPTRFGVDFGKPCAFSGEEDEA